MVIVAVTLAILAVAGIMGFRAARRTGRTIGLLAWRVAQGTAVVFALAVLVYEKPRSFYTNFAMLPSLLLYLSGLLGTIVALILGVTALIKRDDVQRALIAITVSLLSAAISMGLIIWRASEPPPRSDGLTPALGLYARATRACHDLRERHARLHAIHVQDGL
jgi:hypothetical protein